MTTRSTWNRKRNPAQAGFLFAGKAVLAANCVMFSAARGLLHQCFLRPWTLARQAAGMNGCWIDSLVGGANGRAQGNALRMANFLKSAGPLPEWTYRFEESEALSPADDIETVKPWLFSMNAVARRRKNPGDTDAAGLPDFAIPTVCLLMPRDTVPGQA
ncbi:hypothetical protein ABXT00_13600 [Stenotrophomonas koreensis]|uniref:hypothetical protein n=1 Tax=Stenotrophomonas koreensis TaxID=266128 RepID=UPI00339684F8